MVLLEFLSYSSPFYLYKKSLFAQRIKNANTVTPWSVFYPGEEVFKSPRQDLKNVDILNTVMAPGLYWVRKSDGNTGLPRDNIYYGFMDNLKNLFLGMTFVNIRQFALTRNGFLGR